MPPAPRRIAGHHFSDLLICPQRAWLAYHGDDGARLPDPAPLRSLQQAGKEHEAEMYERLYPDPVRIPERLPADERAAHTGRAIQSGAGVILQGYVQTADGLGVIDVLQREQADGASSGGPVYRVGEIKQSACLPACVPGTCTKPRGTPSSSRSPGARPAAKHSTSWRTGSPSQWT
jgi:hypothetical protein